MNQLKNHINLHEKCPSQACINSKSSQPAWKIAKLTMCQLFSMMIHPNLRSEFMIADLIKIHVQVHDELTFDRWINSFDVVFMMNRSSTSLISTQQRSTSWDPLDLSSERWVDDELDDDHRCELMRSKSNFSLMPTSIFKLEWSSSKCNLCILIFIVNSELHWLMNLRWKSTLLLLMNDEVENLFMNFAICIVKSLRFRGKSWWVKKI